MTQDSKLRSSEKKTNDHIEIWTRVSSRGRKSQWPLTKWKEEKVCFLHASWSLLAWEDAGTHPVFPVQVEEKPWDMVGAEVLGTALICLDKLQPSPASGSAQAVQVCEWGRGQAGGRPSPRLPGCTGGGRGKWPRGLRAVQAL